MAPKRKVRPKKSGMMRRPIMARQPRKRAAQRTRQRRRRTTGRAAGSVSGKRKAVSRPSSFIPPSFRSSRRRDDHYTMLLGALAVVAILCIVVLVIMFISVGTPPIKTPYADTQAASQATGQAAVVCEPSSECLTERTILETAESCVRTMRNCDRGCNAATDRCN